MHAHRPRNFTARLKSYVFFLLDILSKIGYIIARSGQTDDRPKPAREGRKVRTPFPAVMWEFMESLLTAAGSNPRESATETILVLRKKDER